MEWLKTLWAWLKNLDDNIYEIVEYFIKLAEWFVDFVIVLLSVLVDFVLGLLIRLMDMVLAAVIALFNTLEIPFNPATYYSMIPPDVASLLGAIGLPQAMAMIVAAIMIRLILQLIPFTRLGS